MRRDHPLLLSYLTGLAVLTVFYTTGILDAVGTIDYTPYMFAGFITGLSFFSVLERVIERMIRRSFQVSLLLLAVIYVFLLFEGTYARVEPAASVFSLSALSASPMLVAAWIELRNNGEFGNAAILIRAVEVILFITVVLVLYIALFEAYMPVILLSFYLISFIAIIAVSLFDRRRGRNGTA